MFLAIVKEGFNAAFDVTVILFLLEERKQTLLSQKFPVLSLNLLENASFFIG